ncbi:MAG: hypothetical protein KAI39_12245 [Desulfobulbaceae bacterium]|nr:hypothetical protein [Desulfobulbaceae bacterium]
MTNLNFYRKIDLCAVLSDILTGDQQYELMERGGSDYGYTLTMTVNADGEAHVNMISGSDLVEVITFVQEAINDFNSFIVVMGSAAIQAESMKHAQKLKTFASNITENNRKEKHTLPA